MRDVQTSLFHDDLSRTCFPTVGKQVWDKMFYHCKLLGKEKRNESRWRPPF